MGAGGVGHKNNTVMINNAAVIYGVGNQAGEVGSADPSKQSLWTPLREVIWSDDCFAKITLVVGG